MCPVLTFLNWDKKIKVFATVPAAVEMVKQVSNTNDYVLECSLLD